MVKRISMTAGGLLVSKPGYDVDTATPAQLALMLGVNYGQVMLEGSINASGSVALAGFSTLPLCFFYSYGVGGMVDPSGNPITAFHVPDTYPFRAAGSTVKVGTSSLVVTLVDVDYLYYLLAREAQP
jgi:hypothetical protein